MKLIWAILKPIINFAFIIKITLFCIIIKAYADNPKMKQIKKIYSAATLTNILFVAHFTVFFNYPLKLNLIRLPLFYNLR